MPQCILLSSLIIISSYFTSVLLKTSFRFEFPRELLKVWDDLENPISLPWVGAWALIVFMSPSDSMGQKRLRTTPLVCTTNQRAAKRLRIQSRDSKLIQSRDIKITPLYSSGGKKIYACIKDILRVIIPISASVIFPSEYSEHRNHYLFILKHLKIKTAPNCTTLPHHHFIFSDFLDSRTPQERIYTGYFQFLLFSLELAPFGLSPLLTLHLNCLLQRHW